MLKYLKPKLKYKLRHKFLPVRIMRGQYLDNSCALTVVLKLAIFNWEDRIYLE